MRWQKFRWFAILSHCKTAARGPQFDRRRPHLPGRRAAGDPGGREPDPREDTIALRLPIRPGAELTVFDVETGQQARTEAVLDGSLLTNVQLRGDSIFVAKITAPAQIPTAPPSRKR